VPQFDSAFITGASSGIGRELARLLASKGTRVVVAARREDELGALCSEITAAGGRADACPLDVTDTTATRAAVQHWEAETGGLDLVVANAGTGVTRPARKLRWEDLEPVLQVNVLGAFATLQPAIAPMVERRRGTLVGVSSLAALRGLPTSGAYAASKAALATFLETLRVDLAGTGVTVVDVRPGFVDTAMSRQNRFKMPFLLQPADAARRALRGIERGQAVVSFPWPTALAMETLESLPDGLFRALASGFRPGRGAKRSGSAG
jgi:short-subunit dehydrogenase